MGAGPSKPEKTTTEKAKDAVKEVADTTVKAVDKAADKVSKAADKAADKVSDTITIFQKKVEKAKEPERKFKAEETLPIVGAVALVVAVGAYLWKKKPWKGDGGAPATA
ncbi:hypothetical protein Rsub_05690 [Raphidocelis subcapitata]|uniref:Uncharacterized protein n=1 Tax=Raphidocelis subcapitata TaxID=307507 RepID=A0A2V0P0H5_9CHLO|nr:hypothetical protein Rsub_05690 [Raphidocelis subcapitata]|eukprot:GBF93079.1 hypothetical protein Rsub_05690 [Raphidocelis subcapitata]